MLKTHIQPRTNAQGRAHIHKAINANLYVHNHMNIASGNLITGKLTTGLDQNC
jgi:hypothetical protein